VKHDSNNPKNGVKLGLEPTPRNKRNRTREKHRRRGYLQKNTA
jgi:hypothetical protein